MGKIIYYLSCEGNVVLTTVNKCELVTYLWGRRIRDSLDTPYRFTVMCQALFVVDTGDLDAFIAQLPE